ncbi:hypothetical protein [Nocardioides sp. B-3]|uniref:hypothetical protein n=1 Tax=Nocardioides sp. B-3 TaxID=2895565 RepID=UPI002153A665|nr:hypothetical protein [Nocardioides sp. B-3]UUZ58505.1 hypothetical protein LP418_20365 [Nocardioides sp. B-3]
MRKTYRFLGYAIAVLVVVQAFAIARAFFGLSNWINNDGGVVDKALLECTDCDQEFTAEWGFAIHMFFNGLMLIPLTTLVMLVVSFFAKVPGGVKMAVGLVVPVALQVIVLPMLAREVGSGFGGLHGLNALLILGLAVVAARRAEVGSTAPSSAASVVV